MRILFHAINGVGLGHLSRMTALATKVGQLEPYAEPVVLTNSPDTRILERAKVPFVRVPRHTGEPGVDIRAEGRVLTPADFDRLSVAVMSALEARMLVVDTHFPIELVNTAMARGLPVVLVLRKTRRAYAEQLVSSPVWRRFAAVVLPHYPQAFQSNADVAFWRRMLAQEHVHRVPPIVRRPEPPGPERLADAADRYAIAGAAPKLLVTAGAGGQPLEASAFFDEVLEAHRRLRADEPRLKTFWVTGPYQRGVPAELPEGVQTIASTPELPDLLGLADVIIAHAGYGSVHEAISRRRPLVLRPAHRHHESQHERAQWCAASQLAVVPRGEGPAALAEAIRRALSCGEQLVANQSKLPRPDATGAARALLECRGSAVDVELAESGQATIKDRYGPNEHVVDAPQLGTWLRQRFPANTAFFVTLRGGRHAQALSKLLSGPRLTIVALRLEANPAELVHTLSQCAAAFHHRRPGQLRLRLARLPAAADELATVIGGLVGLPIHLECPVPTDSVEAVADVVRELEARLESHRPSLQWTWRFRDADHRERLRAEIFAFAETRRQQGLSAIELCESS